MLLLYFKIYDLFGNKNAVYKKKEILVCSVFLLQQDISDIILVV
jgi:hypothetical protein